MHFNRAATHAADHTAIIGWCESGVGMRKRAGWSWLASLGWGRRRAPDANDFGDMGTAFGLDASLADDTDVSTQKHDGRFNTEAPESPANRLKGRSAL